MSKTRITDLIRIGEWLPDRPENNNPGSNNISNVLVEGEDYKPFKDFNATTNAVSTASRIFGAFSFIDDEGNVNNFSGNQDELFNQSGSSWVDVSKTSTEATTYNTPADGQWRFTSFGQRVIATNLADDMQSYIVGTSTSFSNLSTSAPKAKDAAVINNFLVTVHTDDGTIRPNRVQWSALDDPTNFSTSAVTLSDFQDLEDNGGFNQRIIPTQNYGVIMRENQIVRMEFIGTPAIFSFTVAEENRGTLAINSVVSDGTLVYYLSPNGFFAFDGTRSVPIGDNKVDRYFLGRVDNTKIHLVKGAVDPVNKMIAWSYPDSDNQNFSTDLIFYHWTENRWSQAEQNVDMIETMRTAGLTLEGLDAVSTDLDALAFSLDSRVWAGGNPTLGGFSTDHKLGFFDGSNKQATLQSAEAMLNPGGRTYIESVLPVTDSTAVEARIQHRNNQFGSLTNTSSGSISTVTNEVPFRVDDRYNRVELTVPAASTWDLVQGFRFRAKPSGSR